MSIIEDLLDLEVPRDVKLSPDGKQIVYRTTIISRTRDRENDVSTLWLAQTGEEGSARQLTSGKFKDKWPAWSPSGDSIGFVSDREEVEKKSAVYILPMKIGGEPYAVTPVENEQDVTDFQFSPCGKFIAYTVADEKSAERKRKDKDKDDVNVWNAEIEYTRLRLLHIATKKVTTLFANDSDVCSYTWADDGNRIAIVHSKYPTIDSQELHGSDVTLVDVRTGELQHLTHTSRALNYPTWIGDTLFFTGLIREKPTCIGSQCVLSLDLAAGKSEFRIRAFGVDSCAGDIVKVGEDLVVCEEKGLTDELHMLDGKSLQLVDVETSSWDAIRVPDSDELVFAIAKPGRTSPSEVYSTSTSTKTLVQLSDHGAAFKDYDLGTAHTLICRSEDGEVELDSIYYEPGSSKNKSNPNKKPSPTIVIPHGGPYSRATDPFSGALLWIPLLVSQGYGVLSPNYRGGRGRGDAFAQYANGRIGTIEYDDVITLTQNAIERGFADKERTMIGGWSQGGYMSYLATVRNGMHSHGWRFRAAIPGAGVADPDTLAFTSDLGMSTECALTGAAAWELSKDDLRGRRGSPIWEFKAAVDKGGVIPPVLILHGEDDRRVPFEQAVMMRRAFQFHGLPFEFVSYPRASHCPEERLQFKDMLERVLRFVEVHLAAKSEIPHR